MKITDEEPLSQGGRFMSALMGWQVMKRTGINKTVEVPKYVLWCSVGCTCNSLEAEKIIEKDHEGYIFFRKD